MIPMAYVLTSLEIERATEWRVIHLRHVLTLEADGESSYPPAKEDAGRPELWKPAHWRWFRENVL